MAFDTPRNRMRYKLALGQHDKWINHNSRYGVSYTRGWNGQEWRETLDDFEHWCAGKTNRKKRTTNDDQ